MLNEWTQKVAPKRNAEIPAPKVLQPSMDTNPIKSNGRGHRPDVTHFNLASGRIIGLAFLYLKTTHQKM